VLCGKTSAFLLTVLMFLPGLAHAARPLDTEDTGTVDPASGEVELSGNFSRSQSIEAWFLTAKLTIGVAPRLDAAVQTAVVALDVPGSRGEAGLGDTNVRVKLRLLEETPSFPAVLTALDVRLPTGDSERGLGEDDVDVLALAAVSKTIGVVILYWNGGYRFVLRDRDLDAWVLSGALEYHVTAAVSLVGELVSELGTTRARDDAAVLRGGLVYGLTERVRLDGAVGVGLTRASPDVTVTVGITLVLF
jgi:Putative MetA-pathway of phenol degradation